jgi:hypothetical protein
MLDEEPAIGAKGQPLQPVIPLELQQQGRPLVDIDGFEFPKSAP